MSTSTMSRPETVTEENYGQEFKPDQDVKVVKKDGSLEAFNVQKVIDAVGKSATYARLSLTRSMKWG